MPVFYYEALDSGGKPNSGRVEEESAYKAAVSLSERGLRVSLIREQGKRVGLLRKSKALTLEDLTVLNEQLLAVTKSGLSLPPALAALAKDIENKRMKPVIEDLKKHLEAGESLSDAMSRHPESFSPVYLSLIRAGERTGNLPGVLSQLSTYSKHTLEMRNRIQGAIAYPLVVLTAVVLLFGFVCAKVVPGFAQAYEAFDARLPIPTEVCLAIGKFTASYGLTALITLVALIIIAYVAHRVAKARTQGRYSTDALLERITFRLPLLGALYRSSITGRFCRSLGLLLNSKVPAPESIILAATTTGSTRFMLAGLDASLLVNNGETISRALAHTRLFRSSLLWLLEQGEAVGTIEDTLFNLTESYEREVARQVQLVVGLTAPLGVILMGGLVFFTVYAMFMPIFQIPTLMSQ